MVERKYILWMICSFTKVEKGMVVKDKTAGIILKGLHRSWCMDLGFPAISFWFDNGGEFRNIKMEEFVNKLGLKIEFGQAFSHET